jgi:cyclopropane fatty-acyl-phospholipid synthase-like methyltransferase
VDLSKVATAMAREIPEGARVADIGGGDGQLAELLLTLRPDIHCTMTDIAPAIGEALSEANRARATLRPGCDVADIRGRFDVMILADVLHHVRVEHRADFLAAVGRAADRTGCPTVLIKDVRPGGVRARLALWSDRYVTGDRHVALIDSDWIALPNFRRTETIVVDDPNYCAVFKRTAP